MRAARENRRLDAGPRAEDTMSNAATRTPEPDYAGSSWARGLSVFAATMLIVVGAFQFF
jgi:hypothetical protein